MRGSASWFWLMIVVCASGVDALGDDVSSQPRRTASEKPPNVLFIAIDDLRPELGAFGVSYAPTPNLDRLARQGVAFTRHFVQVPTCGASRYALLT
ncbi:MAG: sulfatase-like hydrolase/transferase, partial [Planctomycetaceae bacterium]